MCVCVCVCVCVFSVNIFLMLSVLLQDRYNSVESILLLLLTKKIKDTEIIFITLGGGAGQWYA